MIALTDVEFAYPRSPFRLHIPTLSVPAGAHVALIGPSGAGKTTLSYLVAGILRPQHGSVQVDGVTLSGLSDAARRDFRIARIGFVFQEFELLEYLNVRDNILLPYRINRTLALTPEVRARADTLAASLGLGDKLRRLPQRLSQGERQRVAICRALVTQPRLLIADEPTGNLDPATARSILELLLAEARARDATLWMVTHNHDLLDRFDTVHDIGTYATAGAS
jgi:putative ABC transport system ATP-binding protein